MNLFSSPVARRLWLDVENITFKKPLVVAKSV